jgi:4a-hydroxytetrahydrobiopterin dehydratase
MPRTALSAEALTAALHDLPAWTGDASGIRREMRFDSYEAGVAFAVRVALHAQRVDHHPDLLISWQRVEVRYVTHDAGGVTARDVDAAKDVDAMLSSR